jgi:hypothetical protein
MSEVYVVKYYSNFFDDSQLNQGYVYKKVISLKMKWLSKNHKIIKISKGNMVHIYWLEMNY